MKIEYEPYKMDSFHKLMKWAYGLGWYIKERELITVRMCGSFEGYSGRASETWEHRFYVETCDIPELNLYARKVYGRTLEEACAKLVKILEIE